MVSTAKAWIPDIRRNLMPADREGRLIAQFFMQRASIYYIIEEFQFHQSYSNGRNLRSSNIMFHIQECQTLNSMHLTYLKLLHIEWKIKINLLFPHSIFHYLKLHISSCHCLPLQLVSKLHAEGNMLLIHCCMPHPWYNLVYVGIYYLLSKYVRE